MAESQKKYIPKLSGGINRYDRADAIADKEFVNLKNFRYSEGSLVMSTGYEHLTAPLSTGLVSDVEEYTRLNYEFDISDGTSKLVLVTNYALYLFDGVSSWDQQSVTNAATASQAFTAATSDIITSATHGLLTDDLIKCTTSDTLPAGLANDVIYYVKKIDANTFTLALSSGGADVDITDTGTGTHTWHPCLNGDNARAVKADTWTPSDAMVFTNGVDPLWVYIDDGPGYAVRPVAGLLSSDSIAGLVATAVATCRDVLVWNTRLWLFYVTEGTDPLPQKIRWSSIADFEEYDNTGALDGGYDRLADKDDEILCAYRLSKDIIIYRTESVVKGQWIGSATRTVRFDEVISDEGALGPNAVAVTKDFHMFFGKYNIYKYKGGTSAEEIGTKIRDMVYGAGGILDLDKRTDITAVSLSTLREIWTSILVALSFDSNGLATAYKSTVLIYNITEDSWTLREFNDADGDTRVVHMAEARLPSSLTWDTVTSTWQEAGTLRWNSQVFATDFPGILICSKHDVYNFNHIIAQDEGVDIPFEIVTKDFTADSGFIRFNFLELQHSGNGATVSYSIDYGSSYTTLDTLTASAGIRREKVYPNISAEAIRFKISGNGGGFRLQSATLDFTPDSEI